MGSLPLPSARARSCAAVTCNFLSPARARQFSTAARVSRSVSFKISKLGVTGRTEDLVSSGFFILVNIGRRDGRRGNGICMQKLNPSIGLVVCVALGLCLRSHALWQVFSAPEAIEQEATWMVRFIHPKTPDVDQIRVLLSPRPTIATPPRHWDVAA